MRTVIIHGKRISTASPRAGRPECDLWGVTRANAEPAPAFWGGTLRDWTAWVDVHPLTATHDFPGIPQRRPKAWRWYCAQDGTRPIYLQAPEHASDPVEAARLFAQVPGAVAFPIDALRRAIREALGPDALWLGCQVGMMLAKAALLDGYERIILNGIGCVARIDYEYLHRDILYWMGVARGRGIDVVVEGRSTYHAPPKIYAYETLSFAELARARAEARGPSLAELDELAELNARERARGRPRRTLR